MMTLTKILRVKLITAWEKFGLFSFDTSQYHQYLQTIFFFPLKIIIQAVKQQLSFRTRHMKTLSASYRI